MNEFELEIARLVAEPAGLPVEEAARLIEVPPDDKLGDFAVPCFVLAKRLKQAPPAVAAALARRIRPTALVPEVRAAGPYLNFRVDAARFARSVLGEVLREDDAYGRSDEGAGKTVVIDYSSPNIAKPLAFHHIRSTMIGNALRRIFRALGWRVVGINHLGDWGTQFGKLMVAYRRWGNGDPLTEEPILKLNELYVRFHEEVKQEPALADEARAWFKKLEDGDPEARRLWAWFRELSLKEFEQVYELLRVKFDEVTGESFFNEQIPAVLDEIARKGLSKESEGALVVEVGEKMPPCLLLKGDEATLYATRDIAAAMHRRRTWGFARNLYVVDQGQGLHFRQFFKVLSMMGYDWARDCIHVAFGLVRFKDQKMGTRRGNVILLLDVLQKSIALARAIMEEKNPGLQDKERVARQVGIGAIVFNDLKNGRLKDVNFDWEELLNFDGETGPYVQYTHARIASVLRKAGAAPDPAAPVERLALPDERALIRLIEAYPGRVRLAARDHEPSNVAGHLLETAGQFNRYYNAHRILEQDPELRAARLLLIRAVMTVLRNGLDLLGVEAPEAM